MVRPNYIVDGNPLNLAGPPKYWLKRLHEFDDSLVVMPSRMGYFYRLAQRRPPDQRVNLIHSIQGDNDSNMLRRHNLVPVTTIIATARWDNPLMFEDLRQRMPSRMGGWEKFEAALLAKEAQKELDERIERDNILDVVGKDSFKYYQLKKGVRSHMWSPKTPDRSRNTSTTPMIRILNSQGKPIQTKF